jgi:hypothetical protein
MPTEGAKPQQQKTTTFWKQARKRRQNKHPTCIDRPNWKFTTDHCVCEHVRIAYNSTFPIMEEKTNEWFRASCHTEGVAIRMDGY